MTITVLSDLDGFRTVRGEWNALLEKSGNSTLFLCWEWVFSYYKYMCKDQQLLLLLVRNDNGELKGIAPFVLREERIITKKVFLEVIGQRHSYYLGIIADCNCRDDVYREVFAYLLENRKKWDLINFVHLSDDDGFGIYLKDHWPSHGYSLRESTMDTCKVVPLEGDFEEYVSSLDKGFAKKLRYYLRSLNRDHHVQLAVPADEESLQVYWRTFLDLHQTRVHNKGGQTVLSDPGFQEFYYSVARAAYSDNHLSLVALKLDGEIAAVLFGIIWHTTFYFLNIGYREFSKYSLGLTLPALCIERAIKDGLQYFDFLGGGGDYKEKMGGADRGGLSIQVMRPMILLETKAREGARKVARKMLSRRTINRIKEVSFQ
jgi:CelD/BcsL family acetyltransferase involved in cellulose biosynthesis